MISRTWAAAIGHALERLPEMIDRIPAGTKPRDSIRNHHRYPARSEPPVGAAFRQQRTEA